MASYGKWGPKSEMQAASALNRYGWKRSKKDGLWRHPSIGGAFRTKKAYLRTLGAIPRPKVEMNASTSIGREMAHRAERSDTRSVPTQRDWLDFEVRRVRTLTGP